MRGFKSIHELALQRHGGETALSKLIPKTKSTAALRKLGDDRWLSGMTRSIFQAGFVWRIVENKWPDFERAFAGFDLHAVAYLSEDAIEVLLTDASIIRHHKKILAARDNALYLLELGQEHGSATKYLADYPSNRYIDLLDELKQRGNRLGGTSAQYFLRRIGKDSFILTRDVLAALKREKVIDSTSKGASKRDREAIQEAFNLWAEDSGLNLTGISRVLALGIES